MRVSATEIQNNFGKYLKMATQFEEVIVEKNGKAVAKLTSYNENDIVCEEAAAYSAGNRITYEEFLELTENSDMRYEYIDGEVIQLSSPNYYHQNVIVEILAQFYTWFKGKPCTPLTSPFDVTLYKSEDNINVVQPDIIVICDKENIKEKGKYKGVPALVVEVLSESSRKYDLLKKLDLYMQSGIREYWIVDPVNKQITIYNFNNKDVEDYRAFYADMTATSMTFQGLEINLNDLFNY